VVEPQSFDTFSRFERQSYLRGRRSAEAAVRELLHTASGLKRKGR
jgi:hypothetical protein